jgi:hypothetical protein
VIDHRLGHRIAERIPYANAQAQRRRVAFGNLSAADAATEDLTNSPLARLACKPGYFENVRAAPRLARKCVSNETIALEDQEPKE